MLDQLDSLLIKKRINKYEYDTYFLFQLSEEGRNFLKNMIESILMEEPIKPKEDLFAWHDGRRSIFRDIKRTIDFVNQKIEEVNNA